MIYLFLADGFEEIEALSVVDLVRRTSNDICTVSVTKNDLVTGAFGVSVKADRLFEDVDFSDSEMLILPGGIPGVYHLEKHAGLKQLLEQQHTAKQWIAAICAAPMILDKMGILDGQEATISPNFTSDLQSARFSEQRVVVSGHIITSRGPGTALEFSLEIIRQLWGTDIAESLRKKLLL